MYCWLMGRPRHLPVANRGQRGRSAQHYSPTTTRPGSAIPRPTRSIPRRFNAGTGNYGIGCDSVLIDTAAPNTSITGGPAEGSSSADTTPTFTFTSTEAGGSFHVYRRRRQLRDLLERIHPHAGHRWPHFRCGRSTPPAIPTLPATRGFTITGPPTPRRRHIDHRRTGRGIDHRRFDPEFSFTSTEARQQLQCRVDSAPVRHLHQPAHHGDVERRFRTPSRSMRPFGGQRRPEPDFPQLHGGLRAPGHDSPGDHDHDQSAGGQTATPPLTFEFASSETAASNARSTRAPSPRAPARAPRERSPSAPNLQREGDHRSVGNTTPRRRARPSRSSNQPGDTLLPGRRSDEAEEINDQPESEVHLRLERGRFPNSPAKLDKGGSHGEVATSPFEDSEARQTQLRSRKDSAGQHRPQPGHLHRKVRKPQSVGLRGWPDQELVQETWAGGSPRTRSRRRCRGRSTARSSRSVLEALSTSDRLWLWSSVSASPAR